MAVYRFRIELDYYEEIVREIEIKSDQTFDEFREAILSAFKFKTIPEASFFSTDDLWHMEEEIIYNGVRHQAYGEAVQMVEAKLADYVNDPHQRFIFLFDYQDNWQFNIELMTISETVKPGGVYPTLLKSMGEAPKQSEYDALGREFNEEFDLDDFSDDFSDDKVPPLGEEIDKDPLDDFDSDDDDNDDNDDDYSGTSKRGKGGFADWDE